MILAVVHGAWHSSCPVQIAALEGSLSEAVAGQEKARFELASAKAREALLKEQGVKVQQEVRHGAVEGYDSAMCSPPSSSSSRPLTARASLVPLLLTRRKRLEGN